jgi:hypothetical protein
VRGSRLPWSVPVAGVLVLLAAFLTAVVTASDPPTRPVGLPAAGLVALIGLGLLLRWRWAVRAAIGLVGVGAALTAWAAEDDLDAGQARSSLLLGWFTLLLLALLLPALLRRRSSTGEDAAGALLGRPPTPGQRLLFGLFAVPTVVVGMALFLVVPFGLTSGWRSLGAVAVLLALLLLLGSAAALFRPRRRVLDVEPARIPVKGALTPAFLARYDRLGRAAAAAAGAGAAVVGACVALGTDWPAAVRLPVVALAGAAALGLLVLPATGWRSYVALLPTGLYVPGPRRATFVPWADVEDCFLHWTAHAGGAEPFVAVVVRDARAIRTSVPGRLLHLVNRRFGADLYFPARILATEPEFLVHVIGLYRSSPDRRRAIGTVAERDRLRHEVGHSPVPL